ncbi:putative cysteine protease atg4 [Smittium culicis]|uniref:Cysteine protease n=1 Tax=Smittium culicis TaxID=133412 RepID=A0A1R1YTW8_9FUNG|nr:putative cysteine protease atg4 [Smittium culicis]
MKNSENLEFTSDYGWGCMLRAGQCLLAHSLQKHYFGKRIDRVNPIYYSLLHNCLAHPLCVGIAGGKPSSALYFVGTDGEDLIYLDPHYTRPVIQRKELSDYTETDINSYRCMTPKKISISRIDPCMFIGFYIKNISDLETFCKSINSLVDSKITGTISVNFNPSNSMSGNFNSNTNNEGIVTSSIEMNENLGVMSEPDDDCEWQ